MNYEQWSCDAVDLSAETMCMLMLVQRTHAPTANLSIDNCRSYNLVPSTGLDQFGLLRKPLIE